MDLYRCFWKVCRIFCAEYEKSRARSIYRQWTCMLLREKKTKKISSSESWYEPSPTIKAKRYLSRVPMYCNASNVPDKTSVTFSIIFVSTIWLLPRRERTNVLLLPCHFCFPPTMLCFVAFWSILLQGAVLES